LAGDKDPKNGWLIKTPAKSFAVFAPTVYQEVKCMAHINYCIEAFKEQTGSRPKLGHAAV
jgi:hypothetical protein